MQYKNLGRSGLKVSSICLGTMVLGDQVSETESVKIIKAALASGVNFLDTADVYAEGKSEEVVGKALKGGRDSIVLATKVAGRTGPGANDKGLSRKHIIKGLEDSLKRLQTDYIDLYYTHLPDYTTPLEETLRALDDLVHQGKVRYIGCSNYATWMLCKALCVSTVHNLIPFDCIQSPYNLLARDIEYELLPFCDSEGIGVCTFNPLAGEMLTGRHEFGKPPAAGRFTHPVHGSSYLKRYWSRVNFEAVGRLEEIVKDTGWTLAQFSLAWILKNKTITSVLSGVTSLEQLKENLAATEITLSQQQLKVCDEVWQMFRPPRFAYAKSREDMESRD